MKVFPLIAILAATTSTGFALRVVCYFTNWARYGNDPFHVEDVDPRLCTHVVYSFFGLDNIGNIKSLDPWNDFGDDWTVGALRRFNGLRKLNPNAKYLLGVGGYGEGPSRFQMMFRNPTYRKNFINSTLAFLDNYQFDGVDINVIYRDGVTGQPVDKKGLSDLVQEMKPFYKAKGYIVSLATSANSAVFYNSYDIPTVSKNVDFINILSYDLHGSWDRKTGHVAPLHRMKNELPGDIELNVEAVIARHIKAGADPGVLNMGLVGYGRSFSLQNSNNYGLNAPAIGPGHEEPLPYKSFCIQDKQGTWKKFRNDEQKIPFGVAGDQWVGYEDVQSLTDKVKFAKNKKLGGVTFWSFDMDDFRGNCGPQNYPLLRGINDEIKRA